MLEESEKTVGNVHVQMCVEGKERNHNLCININKLRKNMQHSSRNMQHSSLTPASMGLGAATQESQKETQAADRIEQLTATDELLVSSRH